MEAGGGQDGGAGGEGGEPACLLALLCPACDRVQDDATASSCERCGARLGHDPGPAC